MLEDLHAPAEPRGDGTEAAFRVALVCMPFASAAMPSIQVGLLTAVAEQAGFSTDAYHFTLDLADRIGPDAYELLCGHRGRMTGEWLFSTAAFGSEVSHDDEEYLRAFPEELQWMCESAGLSARQLSTLRHETLPRFIDDCSRVVDWGAYGVIGFTSTFQQNVASLALARRIKQLWPGVHIVMGGANMEDVMGAEYVRVFPFIDYAVVGEGDMVFPELLRALADGCRPSVRGVLQRSECGAVTGEQAAPVTDLNALPFPKYDEFYQRAETLGLEPLPRLPFESSRGCWWARKSQCTFCGLNGLGMSYRAKSAGRLLSELNELGRRYGVRQFDATDNILFPRHIGDVFGTIAQEKTDFEFFYEVKSNLTRDQLRSLHRGGVRRIQPGIESLSTHVLALMKKGATMLQNVRLLKWSRYYRIRVNWNVLTGFPGETSDDYRRQLRVLKQISHLEPPSGVSRIWLERFSPYFVDAASYPIHDVRPEASYAFVYPPHVDLTKAAYFFDYTMDDTVAPQELHSTDDWIAEWRRSWSAAAATDTLTYAKTSDGIVVTDRRGRERPLEYTFDGALGAMVEQCSDTFRSVSELSQQLAASIPDRELEPDEVRGALDELCRVGLMVSEDGHYLSLALPINPNW